MKDSQREIGKRLQDIRYIYNSGFKASIEQFAGELGETKYNISNYEGGKASIPNRVLLALYDKGINPLYILTGEGSRFANNPAGKIFSENLGENSIATEKIVDKNQNSNVEIIGKLELSGLSIDELINQAAIYSAAAGDIMKIIQENYEL